MRAVTVSAACTHCVQASVGQRRHGSRPAQARAGLPPLRCGRLIAQASPGASISTPEPADDAGAAQVPAAPAPAAAAALIQRPTMQQRLCEILSFCLPVVLVPLADPVSLLGVSCWVCEVYVC